MVSWNGATEMDYSTLRMPTNKTELFGATSAQTRKMFQQVQEIQLQNFVSKSVPTWADPSGWVVRLLSKDRVTIVGTKNDALGLKIGTSVDGITWITHYTWVPASSPTSDMNAEAMKFLSDGEILIATSASGGYRGAVWKSTGWSINPATAIWTRVYNSPFAQLSTVPSGSYGGFAYDNSQTIVAAWYGPQANTTREASTAGVYVRRSVDNGITWTEVFNLATYLTDNGIDPDALTSPNGHHVHSVLYDPYWDAYWLAFGDASNGGYCGILYSLDKGTTWKTAYFGTGPWQSVTMYALPDCILFTGDGGTSSGINRINRDVNSPGTHKEFDKAYTISTNNAIGMGGSTNPEPGGWVIIGLTQISGTERVSRLVATVDGLTFYNLYIDTVYTVSGANGMRQVVGPTATGKIIASSSDTRYAGGFSTLIIA